MRVRKLVMNDIDVRETDRQTDDRPHPASDHQNILVVWSLSLSDHVQENRVNSTSFAIDSFLFCFIF